MFNHAWWSAQYFRPVWFAPGDESAIPPEELRPQGGGTPIKVKPRAKTRPAWVIPQQFIQLPTVPVEEDEALMLCGVM